MTSLTRLRTFDHFQLLGMIDMIKPMSVLLLELGKSLLTLGNMLFTLIFIKHYVDNKDIVSLIVGVISFIALYFTAIKLIKKADKKREIN
jgi:hypothetical protein